MSNYSVPITREKLAAYRGGGGFELLARSIEALESTNFAAIAETCKNNQLDGLVLCGGARTHTVSAYLSEYLMGHGCTTKVSHTNTCYHPCILSMQCTYTLSQLNTSPHTLPLTTPLYLYHHPHSLTPPSHHPLTPPPPFSGGMCPRRHFRLLQKRLRRNHCGLQHQHQSGGTDCRQQRYRR